MALTPEQIAMIHWRKTRATIITTKLAINSSLLTQKQTLSAAQFDALRAHVELRFTGRINEITEAFYSGDDFDHDCAVHSDRFTCTEWSDRIFGELVSEVEAISEALDAPNLDRMLRALRRPMPGTESMCDPLHAHIEFVKECVKRVCDDTLESIARPRKKVVR